MLQRLNSTSGLLLNDAFYHRGKWPLGVVKEHMYPGRDGKVLGKVRSGRKFLESPCIKFSLPVETFLRCSCSCY